MEKWAPIARWKGWYEVSDLGRVRSLDRTISCVVRGKTQRRLIPGKVLRPGHYAKGYPLVTFTAPGGVRECHHIHKLVAAAFLGPVPVGMEVCHRDGDRANPRLKNLRYGTRVSNAQDRHLHGTMPSVCGEDCGTAKLTEAQVREARALRGVETQRSLGARFGVAHTTVGYAQRRVQWRHIT